MYMTIPKATYCSRGISQIKDIFELQIRLMSNFVNYVEIRSIVTIRLFFFLNRFHLSTYTMGITDQPKLEREYKIVLKVLRTLPMHVFILQLRENEIESRSFHPERCAAWQKFQQQILERDGFQSFVKAKRFAQKAMVETAIRQQIPFSIFRLPSAPNAKIAVRRRLLRRLPKICDANFDPRVVKSYQRKRPPRRYIRGIFRKADGYR